MKTHFRRQTFPQFCDLGNSALFVTLKVESDIPVSAIQTQSTWKPLGEQCLLVYTNLTGQFSERIYSQNLIGLYIELYIIVCPLFLSCAVVVSFIPLSVRPHSFYLLLLSIANYFIHTYFDSSTYTLNCLLDSTEQRKLSKTIFNLESRMYPTLQWNCNVWNFSHRGGVVLLLNLHQAP